MAKERSGSTTKAGKVVIDPPPAPVSLLTGGDEEQEGARREARSRWEAETRGTVLIGSLVYACEQWSAKGLDPAAVMQAVAERTDPILADAVMALTERPQVEVRKPRQGKSKWTDKEQGELILAVRRKQALQRTTLARSKELPKVQISTVCNALVGRNGPQKWSGMSGPGLATRYREALKSPVGLLLDHLLTEATHARSQGKIDADELAVLFGHLDRFVASL